jgi:hypothetical protein
MVCVLHFIVPKWDFGNIPGSAFRFVLLVLPFHHHNDHMSRPCRYRLLWLIFLVTILSPRSAIAGPPTDPPVKKSARGICHDTSDSAYARTQRYQSFASMDACLASGGRRSRVSNAVPASKPTNVDVSDVSRSSDWWDRHDWQWWAWFTASMGSCGWVGAALRDRYLRWRYGRLGRAQDELERRRWEGHKRDSNDVFKHRRHKRDPWLKRIGYFKKSPKPPPKDP